MPVFLKAQFGLCRGMLDTSEALEEFYRSLEYINKALEHLKFECDVEIECFELKDIHN